MPKYLRWEDWNSGILEEDGFYVYKSLTPMNTAAMPNAHALLAPGVTEFTDPDEEGAYYIVSAFKGARQAFSVQLFLTPEWTVSTMGGAFAVKPANIRVVATLQGAFATKAQARWTVSALQGAFATRPATNTRKVSVLQGAFVVKPSV